MNIKEIIAKLMKGEALTDEEKKFVESYDEQTLINTASAAARRKAEEKTKEATDKLTASNSALAELQEKLKQLEAEKDGKANAELVALQKKVAKLEATNAANEAKLKANARMTAIREAAKQNGVNAADGVSAAALERLIDLAVGETDVADADAMKAVFDHFKADNPAMIRAEVKGGSGVKGNPSGADFTGLANPWKQESFNLTKQIEVSEKNPQLAATMKSEAGIQTQTA